ncbi:MAG: HK97 gp10 family phage protein [Rhodobiaceae bacterium]|nr:HK97 gp10 family phage protein [Rhodobiaceae bacterium]MCC0055913.1 HK97 gp10 family phage protein [Rhodobiaceae bacterium]
MKTTMKLEGFRELDKALGELPKATGKNVLRKVGRKALEPMRADAEAKAPELTGHLKASVKIGTKLTSRQARQHRRMFKNDKASVELFMGPNDPAAIPQEFGWENGKAQPFMRPAWDAGKNDLLDNIKRELGDEIDKAAKRLAKKQAKAAKG